MILAATERKDHKTIEKYARRESNIRMTALLEKAFGRVSALPVKRQNALAHLLLNEIDSDAQWDASFKSSHPELAELAGKALTEHRKGKTRAMDLTHDF